MSQHKITLAQCTSLVTGNLIGSGVFMLPTLLAAYGSISILSWICTSLGAIFLALVFAKLSQLKQELTSGPHAFIATAFGNKAGFWSAWGYWILTWSSNTAIIVAATSYLTIIYGDLSPATTLAIQIAIWAIITSINLYGITTAAKFELIITILKLIPIVLIPIVGVFFIHPTNFLPFHPINNTNLTTAIPSCIFLTLWAFIGVESATVPAKDVVNPNKTIAIATIVGTAIAAITYILGSISTIGVLGVTTLSKSNAPYADLAQIIFGGNWGGAIAVCAIISCIGAFNGWSLVVARIAQGAAQANIFPKIFAKTSAQGNPIHSIIISSVCTLIAIIITAQPNMLSQFNIIIDTAVTLILFVYLASIAAYFKLLSKITNFEKIIGIIATLFVAFGIYASGLTTVFNSILLLLTGIPVYYLTFKAPKL